MKTTTLAAIKSHKPCASGWARALGTDEPSTVVPYAFTVSPTLCGRCALPHRLPKSTLCVALSLFYTSLRLGTLPTSAYASRLKPFVLADGKKRRLRQRQRLRRQRL